MTPPTAIERAVTSWKILRVYFTDVPRIMTLMPAITGGRLTARPADQRHRFLRGSIAFASCRYYIIDLKPIRNNDCCLCASSVDTVQ